MLVLSVILCFTVLGLSSADHQMWEQYKEASHECLEATSTTFDELKAGWKLEELPEKNLCFYKCIMEKQGVLDEEGVVQIEKVTEMPMMAKLDESKRDEIVDCIKGVDKIKTCQDVSNLNKCYGKTIRM